MINSLRLQSEDLEQLNLRIQEKYRQMKENEIRVETEGVDDADYVVVAYGTTARIAWSAIQMARKKGLKIGLIRPITLYPFPEQVIGSVSEKAKFMLTVEMNSGQMVDDVRLAANGRCPVYFYGRTGGMIPSSQEICDKLLELAGGEG